MNHRRDAETQSTDESILTGQVIGACIEVHRHLGPGLVESIYEECLCDELKARGIAFARQQAIPIRYKGRQLCGTYRIDVVVDDELIIEIKAVEQLLPIHDAQLLTYLKLTPYELGLLINFNVPLLRQGIRRLAHSKQKKLF